MLKKPFPWDYFLLTFGFSWIVLLPGVLASYNLVKLSFPNILLVAIAQFGPSLASFFLTFRRSGKVGTVNLVRQALNFKISPPWLAVIFLLPLILSAVAWKLNGIINHNYLPLLLSPTLLVSGFLTIFFFQGPVPEEFGWRGYALPRLTEKFGFTKAALFLGAVWAFWHLPGFFMQGVSQSNMPLIPYFISVTAFSVIIAYIYFGTGKNLLAALLAHTMFNLSIGIFPPMEFKPGADPSGFNYLVALYAIVAFLIGLKISKLNYGKSR